MHNIILSDIYAIVYRVRVRMMNSRIHTCACVALVVYTQDVVHGFNMGEKWGREIM